MGRLLGAPRSRCRRLVLLLLPALGCVAACGADPGPARPPNIVLVIGDDHGWPDSGFMGSRVARTPHLDELAREGVVFTHGFSTSSSCRPALLSLLTGFHPLQLEARLGQPISAFPLGSPAIIASLETLPELLAERGYVSLQGGKFWEGSYTRAGFSEGVTGAGSHGLELGRAEMQPLWDFIGAHRDEPFFVWFAPLLPHLPFDAPKELEEPYRELGLDPAAAGYFANVTRLDQRVGEIAAFLESAGLRDRTLLVYLSDNGWEVGGRRHPALGGDRGKFSIYELGFRTPVLMSWPGVLPEGMRDDRLLSSVDLFATLLDFAGVEVAPDRPGRSLRALLLEGGEFRREQVAGGMTALRPPLDGAPARGRTRAEVAWFLRTGDWRYVRYPERGREELYRIGEDPFEERDVADSHPDELAVLRRDLAQWIRKARHSAAGPADGPF